MTTARDVIAKAIQQFLEMDTMCEAYLEEAENRIRELEGELDALKQRIAELDPLSGAL